MKTGTPRHVARPVALALAFALLLTAWPAASARQGGGGRGLSVEVNIRAEDGSEVKLYERSYALVIGASDYTAGWPSLPGVKKDVESVARALEAHGFQVTVVLNPDAAQLDKSFRAFIDEHGANVENRLLFYFAGHGHTVRQSYGDEMGYIVPTDAPNPNRNQPGFMSKAMDMQQIEVYARRIQSKHALFIFDSCFSGSIFALARAVPAAISYKTAQPVRQFITSGSADEAVPDKSVFREQFVEAIGGEADGNRDGYVTGSELGEFLQDKVVNYSRNAQHPQYGKIRSPNLDKGDFVFALPKAAGAPPAVAAATPKPAATPAPTPTPARIDPLEVELRYWDSIKDSKDPEEYRDYLKRYPQGQFAEIARRRAEPRPARDATDGEPPQPTAAASPTPTPSARPATKADGPPPAKSTPANPAPARPSPGTVIRTGSGIELVYVPPGEFTMGSENGNADEQPAHRVAIREGFWMGKYEVTQGQWRAVMGTNLRQLARGCPVGGEYYTADADHDPCAIVGEGDEHPIYFVGWKQAKEFIRRLNARGDGYTYRLPSEAEWEYACRAGETGEQAANLNSVAWHLQNSDGKTHPVGQKQPNGFGLHDMLGNVLEWCEDVYHDNYNGAPTDGSAWVSGGSPNNRVSRGSSWYGFDFHFRYAARAGGEPAGTSNVEGFRVVAVARQ